MDSIISPYTVTIEQSAVDDLKARLNNTRLATPETVEDWTQGVPLSYLSELVRYWRDDYDFERLAATLNQYPNWITSINGLDIHFIHVRSQHPGAEPLLITHGWPGSVLEYIELISPLTDPVAYGGTPDQAFHVVLPSLPGFGFSGKPDRPGVGVGTIAAMWDELMARLGYENFLAHGGDWGSLVTHSLVQRPTTGCIAAHCTLPILAPDEALLADPNEDELDALSAFQFYQEWDSGYSKIQSTRPQSLAYGLADSPAGQLAWIIEKFAYWTDCVRHGIRHPENSIGRDTLLDNVTLYWMTNSAGSSAQLYWESFNSPDLAPIEKPMGLSVFPAEIMRASERWAGRRYQNLIHFNNSLPHGGHFSAMEAPKLLLKELHDWARKVREAAG
jgi:pimeloyl-ACP methyl ester carboxylesterase